MPAGCGSASSGSCVSSNPSASIVTWRERGIPTVRSAESSLHFSLSAMRCAGSHTALASDGGGGDGRLHCELERARAESRHAREAAIGNHHRLEGRGPNGQRARLLRENRVTALTHDERATAAVGGVLTVLAELLDDRLAARDLGLSERRSARAHADE